MKVRPIHENLDTSFVNLSALVRYLRRRGFVGRVRVELSGYEADIYLGEANGLRVREHDQIAGRIAEGEEALQRILIRSREPGGIVSVYQAVAENESDGEKAEPKQPIKAAETKQTASIAAETLTASSRQIQSTKPVSALSSKSNENTPNLPEKAAVENRQPPPKPKISLPDFPFELSNRVENKARHANLSPNDWQTLLNLTSEFLAAIDQTLAEANLDFEAAFQKARAEIAPDYPFLSSAAEIFEYKAGKISMREQVNANLFAASLVEAVRRILERLGANPKFSGVYRQTTQKILALARRRKPLYDKFSITKPLEKVLGI